MMRLIARLFLGAVGLVTAVIWTETPVSGYSFGETYDRLCLSDDVLVQADEIFICVPALVWTRQGDNNLLAELRDCRSIQSDSSSESPTGRLFLVYLKRAPMGSPAFMPEKQTLMFVKREIIDEASRAKFNTEKSAKYFRLCDTWRAAVCLDFSVKSLHRNILKKRYGIDNPEDFLTAVKSLSRWRIPGSDQKQSIKDLLTLLNSKEQRLFYEDNVPQILLHLGVKKDNKFIVQEEPGHVVRDGESK